MFENNNRLGRFSIDEVILNYGQNNIPIMMTMGRCIVLEAKYNIERRSFDYLAFSPEFDVVPFGEEAPYYQVMVNAYSVNMRAIDYKIQFIRRTKYNKQTLTSLAIRNNERCLDL